MVIISWLFVLWVAEILPKNLTWAKMGIYWLTCASHKIRFRSSVQLSWKVFCFYLHLCLPLLLSLSLFGPSSASLPLDGMTVARYIYFWSVLPSLAFSTFLLSSKLYIEKGSGGAVTGLVWVTCPPRLWSLWARGLWSPGVRQAGVTDPSLGEKGGSVALSTSQNLSEGKASPKKPWQVGRSSVV